MMLSSPPQFGQCSKSIANTRLSKRAQLMRTGLPCEQPGSLEVRSDAPASSSGNRGFGEWADIFSDAVLASALLDRLLHHAVVIAIEGNSYRLREHAALIPEHLRGCPILADPTLAAPRRPPGRPRQETSTSQPG
ncbi:MAG: ATP-binding protein [Burkholderiales bacterium]